MEALHYQSLSDVCRHIKSGALSSYDVTEHILDRITRHDSKLNSYAMVLQDAALERATSLDRAQRNGEPLGLLHGVPIAIKDLLYTKGMVTASGTQVMADFVPTFNATVVEKLLNQGAVIVGKTQLTEGAFGVHHPNITAPKNPWNLKHWPGVSSSGSGVSVAAGMAFGALGTDTGGSIRFPSASCGLVGIKPTYGRVSRHGAFALAHSMDHIGPMTRTVEDAARMLRVVAGHDLLDPSCIDAAVPNYLDSWPEDMGSVTIGIDWEYVGAGVDVEVVEVVRRASQAFAGAGAELKEVQLPKAYQELVRAWGITCGYECVEAHKGMYPEQAHMYGPVLSSLLDLGLITSAEQYAEIEKIRKQFTQDLDLLFQDIDLLITPCMTCLPPTAAEMENTGGRADGRADFITFTAPFDYSGHPTISLPSGLSEEGLPLSYQLVAPRLKEANLVSAGLHHERLLGVMPNPRLG